MGDAANSTVQHKRKVVGRPFKKGQSGNPTGRPRVVAYLRDLALAHTDDALNTIIELLNSSNEKIRIEAARELLDRGYGRPSQSVQLSGSEDMPLRIAFYMPRNGRDGNVNG